MKHLNALFLLIFLFYSNKNHSQRNYPKEIVSQLASSKMHGRGYVNNGDKIAAKYIRNEFKSLGLQSFEKKYFQYFSFGINTQPSALNLELDNLLLKPGKDYLVDPGSPTIKGDFECILFTTLDLLNNDILIQKLNKSSGKILLIDNYNTNSLTKKENQKITEIIAYLKYSPNHPAKGTIVFTNKKLTWHGSTVQNSKASFTVSKKIDISNIKKISIHSKSKFTKKYTSQNCIAKIKGKSTSDSLIVLSAHYDHLGRMGKKTYFPGANDNASGIAMLLNLAKYYSKSENQPKYTLVFIAFGGEEIGLLGSKFFTEHPIFPLKNIKFLLNFDLAGTGSEGIKIVNGSVYKSHFENLVNINKKHKLLKEIKIRGRACNSDHCNFDQLGIPCFYSYTLGGIKAYHDIYDKAETLPLTEFKNYQELIKLFIKTL